MKSLIILDDNKLRLVKCRLLSLWYMEIESRLSTLIFNLPIFLLNSWEELKFNLYILMHSVYMLR